MQSYSTIIGVIELRQGGAGYRTSKKRYNIGNSTVTLIMNRFQELGISLDELKAMPPRRVETAFYPPENLRRAEKEIPDFFKIHKAMMAMDTPDLAFQWMEYKKDNPNGYQLLICELSSPNNCRLFSSKSHCKKPFCISTCRFISPTFADWQI